MKIHEIVKEVLIEQKRTQRWLCKETGIPASHLSEFFNGSRSFKLEKLDKIAAALGKKWNLVDDEKKTDETMNISVMEIKGEKGVLKLRPTLFWDTDITRLDADRNSRLIIERVFTRGTIPEFSQVIQYYGENELKRIIINVGFLDNKTLNFASQVLKISKNEFLCYKKKQSIKTHWH